MDSARIREIVTAFADRPDDVILQKGRLVAEVQGRLLDVELIQRDASIYVKDDGTEYPARDWIAIRLAMLPTLAGRILEVIPPVQCFVPPRVEGTSGTIVIDGISQHRDEDATVAITSMFTERPAGTCSVVYLISDAGEGKTTVINQAARRQAEAFRSRKSNWLLLPIALGGRPFLRFEDVIVAALVNQFRFQRFYFEAFLELVRLGVLVPALDGFEEVFVETKDGDAVSSLGALIAGMKGEGALLVAARKAYFEYKSLEAQARLLDALPDADVTFSRLALQRWQQSEFVQYCRLRNVADPETFYHDVAGKVGADHPLVTRPVLIRRLVDVLLSSSKASVLADLDPDTEAFFGRFIDTILQREASEKWVDKYGEPPSSLLSVQEHRELLGLVAEEMWITKTGTLSGEMLDSLAELYCDGRAPAVALQVRERLRQHALLVAVGAGRREYAFDHEHFREYFIGEQVGHYLCGGVIPDVRKILRVDLVSPWVLDVASHVVRQRARVPSALRLLQEIVSSEPHSSFVKENAGGLCIRLLADERISPLYVEGFVFPPDSLAGRSVRRVTFKGCHFRATTTGGTHLDSCVFQGCGFEQIELATGTTVIDVHLDDCRVHALTVSSGEEDPVTVYAPDVIDRVLARQGFEMGAPKPASTNEALRDEELHLVEKAVRAFQRATRVSDVTLRLRMGTQWSFFAGQILPALLSAGVLHELPHRGSGVQRQFRLGIPMTDVAAAFVDCNGSYDAFMANVNARSPSEGA